jgi:sugar phosphate isomerase/epimerase
MKRIKMSRASFTLSAFGDEIAKDLEEQLSLLNELKIGYLELRAAWGVNVLRMDDETVARVRRTCAGHGVAVGCIGSPIGKSPIADPIEKELANLSRIFQIGAALDCRRVRIFSFYPPDTSDNTRYDEYIEEAAGRLAHMADLAQREGFTLLLENEKDIVGDTLARCHALVSAIASPHLRFLWDPANFVQVGEAQVTGRGWPLLGEYVSYVHIKDAHLADGSVCAAGEGDGQVQELLIQLKEVGYRGFLALEPHLAVAGHSGGLSGASAMTYAIHALRRLMAETGCVETEAAA